MLKRKEQLEIWRKEAKEDSVGDKTEMLGTTEYAYRPSVGKEIEKDPSGNVKNVFGNLQTDEGVIGGIAAKTLDEYYKKVDEYYDAEQKKVDEKLAALKPKAVENVISALSFEDMTPQKLNEDITLKTLKLAQSLGYEVIYNNNDYKIANIGSNSVTLKTALGTKVVVNENKIKSSLRIVKPGIKEATKEENETIKSNEKIVSENPKEFTEEKVAKLTIEEYKTLFKKSICS